jgi:prephenate dehydrogenase
VNWQQITLLGVGLLGGSVGLAVKARRLAARVVGHVRRTESIEECHRLGITDHATLDVAEAVRDADLVILCTPLAQMRPLAERMLPALRRGAIVTDVGSVKGSIVAEIDPLIRGAGGVFVGAHPMAGGERMGAAAARADLFDGAVCVLTPVAQTPAEALRRVEEFWRGLGSRTVRMTPDRHDDLVSRSSHLPHVVAAELVNYVLSPVHPPEQGQLCAAGFRDTTRIAGGSPEMWRDIAMANRRHLARVLGVFIEDLQEFQHALERGDEKTVAEFFETAKKRRDGWSTNNNTASPE